MFLLVVLIVESVRGQGGEVSQDEAASCHNIFQTKMSSTSALQYSLQLAKNEIKELHVSLNETQDMQKAAEEMKKAAQDMLNDAKGKEKEVEKEIMSKQGYVEELESFIQNLTIEVQELHITCDGILSIDCCQVYKKYYKHSTILIIFAILFHRLKQLVQ